MGFLRAWLSIVVLTGFRFTKGGGVSVSSGGSAAGVWRVVVLRGVPMGQLSLRLMDSFGCVVPGRAGGGVGSAEAGPGGVGCVRNMSPISRSCVCCFLGAVGHPRVCEMYADLDAMRTVRDMDSSVRVVRELGL